MTAPQAFQDPTISWYKFYVILKLKLKGIGDASVARQIGVSRNGLFLLHGLNSSRECFFPFREYLLNTAQSYFVNQIYLGDYSSTNTSSFSDNTHVNRVVEKGLHQLCENLLKAGIASTKYDMIGHSMGGILERLYIQEVDVEHTNRLITLNTPHFGSILGNIFIDYDEFRQTPGVGYYNAIQKFNELLDKAFSRDRSMQAVKDLAKNSPAIQRLASKREAFYGIPVCAVGSEISKWGLTFAIKEGFYAIFPKIASFLFDAKPGTGKAYLDKQAEKGSDYVVSVESQKGGCEYSYIHKGGYTQAMHCHVTEWNIIL
jgi:pimeloyl-ACP methyl ester carboxylesterase